MEKVQDTHLNIGGLNWPVLINVEQVCRVMVDLRNNIDLGLRYVLDCIKAINRRIKVRKRVSCCFKITEWLLKNQQRGHSSVEENFALAGH